MESLPWKMCCGTVVTTWLPSPTGVPPSARKDLGFFHTTDVGEKLEAKQVWLWTDGSMPPTVQVLEEVCLWFGKDEHENRYSAIYNEMRHQMHEIHTKSVFVLSPRTTQMKHRKLCGKCLILFDHKWSPQTWHIMTSWIFCNFQITILKLLRYLDLDLPFLPRAGTQNPTCLASSI